MRYLITGATGFVGPHLIRKLSSMGHSCRCLVRSSSKGKVQDEKGVEWVVGDITDRGSLEGIGEGMDGLFHMATLGHMSNYRVPDEMFEKVNVMGTRNIMEEALRSGIPKIVHCSTVAAMGICNEIPANERTTCNPHHPYGQSKLKAEQAVLHLVSSEGLPARIIRFSMVFGPGDWRDILKLTRMAKRGLFPKVGSKPKLTPLVHVDDATEGLLLTMEKGRAGEIYLITNRRSEPFDKIRKTILKGLGIVRPPLYVPEWFALSAASLMEKVFSLAGKAPPVTRKNIESTLADRVFSIEKARRELGFAPRVDPVEGLMETVQWYRKKGWV
ncbi:NAD-dependent epimerase/dehydratase family protein [Thermodesulfobacteriota bacterium]